MTKSQGCSFNMIKVCSMLHLKLEQLTSSDFQGSVHSNSFLFSISRQDNCFECFCISSELSIVPICLRTFSLQVSTVSQFQVTNLFIHFSVVKSPFFEFQLCSTMCKTSCLKDRVIFSLALSFSYNPDFNFCCLNCRLGALNRQIRSDSQQQFTHSPTVPMSLRIGQGILDSQPCSSDSHLIRFVPDLSHYM